MSLEEPWKPEVADAPWDPRALCARWALVLGAFGLLDVVWPALNLVPLDPLSTRVAGSTMPVPQHR